MINRRTLLKALGLAPAAAAVAAVPALATDASIPETDVSPRVAEAPRKGGIHLTWEPVEGAYRYDVSVRRGGVLPEVHMTKNCHLDIYGHDEERVFVSLDVILPDGRVKGSRPHVEWNSLS